MQDIKNEFNDLIDNATSSEAYLDYCTELYGYRMYLFNMMDKFQLDYLFNNISISKNDSILDLGCLCQQIIYSKYLYTVYM